ncbi:CPBP family intramembrane metalloprotease [Actinoplanes sp. LDG1-06]|uniref:CPBP family intramembrane metalloprotease n=1 Tax=Paractinoplanes ovalisporus TaxID=2810368 RepID=A0ABS2AF09_9ACTN|nr:CPBP family glutamic-type intramembrane protease [Actinoplanes ovalisporus]MBM2618415.1 CPBP family intramembrane metalloprotease [Actinoplanes ovalisporus]
MIDSRQFRAGAWFVAVTFAVVTLVNAVFLFAREPAGAWFPFVAPLVPATVSLLIVRGMGLAGGVEFWWALRPPNRRALADGAIGGLLIAFVVSVAAAVLAHLAGLATLWPADVMLSIATTLPIALVLSTVSTFVEEVGWRGFLQRALAPWAFWRSSLTVAAGWAVVQAPVYAVSAMLGDMSWQRAVIWSASLVPNSILLSAFVVRWGSIWPAVLAGAMPTATLGLLRDSMWLSPAEDLLIAGIGAALAVGTAAILTRARPGRSSRSEPSMAR